jgi:hypothetical protein
VLLKRLQEGGKATVDVGPRALQLTNPLMTGPDVKEAQRLLTRSKFGSFEPGAVDGEYGEISAGATRRAKWELGYPDGSVNGSFGPQLKAFLAGKKPLPRRFQQRRTKRLAQARSEKGIRKRGLRRPPGGVHRLHAAPPSADPAQRRQSRRPGHLVAPSTGQHVCIVVSDGPDPMLVSHGDSSGPKRLRFSAEDSYQRRHGHGRTTWLSAF